MTNFLPLFPLGIVAFPGEQLNLHIFEPRYRQLIQDCLTAKRPFGILPILAGEPQEIGTVMDIVTVAAQYPGGEMDIITQGVNSFRLLEHIQDLPEKAYTGGIVHHIPLSLTSRKRKTADVLPAMHRLHAEFDLAKKFAKAPNELTAFDIAHHCGLNVQQEYELLCLTEEDQRLEYLARHFEQLFPVVDAIKSLQARVQLNGHFKSFPGLDWPKR